MGMFCGNCGSPLKPGANFCGVCGKAVGAAGVPAAPPRAPAAANAPAAPPRAPAAPPRAPAAPPRAAAAAPVRPVKRARKKGWLAAVAVIALIALSIGFLPRFLPGILGGLDGRPVTVSRAPEPPAAQTASEASALALRQYLYARLETEAFFNSAETATREELAQKSEELLLIWEEAELAAAAAAEISEQAVSVLEAFTVGQTAAFGQPRAQFMTLAATGADALAIPLASGGEPDPKTWAESLTKQFDALKGAKRYSQLARQLGIDAETAYEQMALAQKILHDDATAEADYKDSLLKAAQVIKTASKVGVFITATIATGGGTLTALSTSGFTVAQTAGTIIGGVDCIVDVADTGSTVFLGEDNQVALAATEVKKYLGPISSVMGLLSWQDAASGEKLAYVGDTLSDWFFEGKVMGVQVFADRDGGMKLTVKALEATGEAGLKAALEAAGYVFPDSEDVKALSDAVNGWKPDREQLKARLDALSAKMEEIRRAAEEGGLSGGPEEGGVSDEPDAEPAGEASAISGWPGDFYGVSLPAPQTAGAITELVSRIDGFGDEVTTIRIDGMTYQEFERYYETLTALPEWTPHYESNMPWDTYDADTDYEFDGIYGALEHVAIFFFDQETASSLDIPQFQMFVYKEY